MQQNIDVKTRESLSEIETMVLMAAVDYEGSSQKYFRDVNYRGAKGNEAKAELINASVMFDRFIPKRKPEKSYTFDMLDEDRVFALNPDLLIDSPQNIVGDGIETILIDDEKIKWLRVEPASKRLKRLVHSVNASSFYLITYMEGDINTGRWAGRSVDVGALDKKGRPAPTSIGGRNEPLSKKNGEQIILASSIVDDCKRSKAITATIKIDSEIIMPIGLEMYKDALILRDAPTTATGRKNPILHWVSQHKRYYKSGKVSDISQFKRGVVEIIIDGITLSLSLNGDLINDR